MNSVRKVGIFNRMSIEKLLPEIEKNVLLKNYTTFKIGGPAKYFFVAKTKENLLGAIRAAKEINLPFFILGGGSNLLAADEGYRGLVIEVKSQKLKFKKNMIFADAGVPLSQLVSIALKNNLAGLEWAIGISGTAGGAIMGNAGAFGKSMRNIVKEVEFFDAKNQRTKTFKSKNCGFKYRDSIFKKNKNLVILSVVLQLRKGKGKGIKDKIEKYLNYRKETQPLNYPSAGSIFVNPPGLAAGKLIESCGLKGKKLGNVKISEKHANFIVNLGKGTAKDVKKLLDLVKKRVKNKFGVKLEEEIQYLGF